MVGQDDFVNQKNIGKKEHLANSKGKEVSVLVKQGYQSSIDKFKLEDENGNDLPTKFFIYRKVVFDFLL